MTWHAETPLLDRYADDTLDAALAASVEAHLLACDPCRRHLATRGQDRGGAVSTRVPRIWDDIVDELDRPRTATLERVLRGLGLQPADARIATAAPGLRTAWLVAVILVAAFAVAAAHSARNDPILFLVLAPLVPLAGVAVSFGPTVDPLYELTVASPISAWRVLVVRTLVVAVTAATVLVVATAVLPVHAEAAAWVVPTLATTAAAIALGPRFGYARGAALSGGAWLSAVGTVMVVATRSPGQPLATDLVLFRPAGQLVLAAITIAAATLAWRQRDAVMRPGSLETHR